MVNSVFGILFLSGLIAQSDISVSLELEMDLPRDQRGAGILPTAVEVYAPTANQHKQLLYPGYGDKRLTLNPFVPVTLAEGETLSSAEDRNREESIRFRQSFDIFNRDQSDEAIERARKENLRSWQLDRMENLRIESARLELRALLSSDQNRAYLQLGGSPVFFYSHDQNFRELLRWPHSKVARPSGSAPSLSLSQKIGAAKLEEWKNDFKSLSYRFYRYSIGVASFSAQQDSPLIYTNELENYFEIIGRYEDEKGQIQKGLQPANARKSQYHGFVFSTCVSFQDLGDEDEVDFDADSLCWIYDKSQAGKILPLLSSSDSRGGTYIVEKTVVSASTQKTQTQKVALGQSQFVNLATLNWR